MRIWRDGDLFRGSHIPGPSHNFLAMRVAQNHGQSAVVKVLPPIGECVHEEGLTVEAVLPWLLEGVNRANEQLGTQYAIGYAEVVENDSPRPEVYVELARRIVAMAHDAEPRP
jgi:hypothetical protein